MLKIVGVLSKHFRVFLESLWQSSDIFGNFRKFSENVRERSSGLRNNFGKSLESGRKSSENHPKRRHQYVYIMKRTLHVSSKIWTLCSRGRTISHSFAALTREILFLPLEHKIHIFSPPCNILYIINIIIIIIILIFLPTVSLVISLGNAHIEKNVLIIFSLLLCSQFKVKY